MTRIVGLYFLSSYNYCYGVLFLLVGVNALLLTYLLAWLLTCFLPSLLTYSLPVPYIRKCCWTRCEFFQKHTWTIIFQKMGIKVNFGFHNETYVLLIFNIQININCKKYIIVVVLTFSQFKPLPVPKNLENAPALV